MKTTMMLVSGTKEYPHVLEVYKNPEQYGKYSYWVVNGNWQFYYKNGVVTYLKGDWRYGKSVEAVLYEDIKDYGSYNENIGRFRQDVLGVVR